MSDVTLSYQTADGSIFSATGWIHIDSRDAEDGKLTMELHPRTDWTSLGARDQLTTGTLKKIVVDGITYDVLSDSNPSETVARYKNESIATSGKNIRKMTAQSPIVKSVTINATQVERDTLKALADTP